MAVFWLGTLNNIYLKKIFVISNETYASDLLMYTYESNSPSVNIPLVMIKWKVTNWLKPHHHLQGDSSGTDWLKIWKDYVAFVVAVGDWLQHDCTYLTSNS